MRDVTIQSKYFPGSTQDLTIWDSPDANYPVIVCAEGWDEMGTKKSAGGSVSDKMRKGLVPTFYNKVYSRNSTFAVVQVHKPGGGVGYFEPQRFKDAVDVAVAGMKGYDPSQVYIFGLSLSAGGVVSLAQDPWSAKIAGFFAASPLQDADDKTLFENIKNNNLFLQIWDAMGDKQQQTTGADDHYKIYSDINYPALGKNGNIIFKQPLGGDHSTAWVLGSDPGHPAIPMQDNSGFVYNPNMWEWFLTKQRTDLAVKPPVVVTPPAVVPPQKTVLKTIPFDISVNAKVVKSLTITVYNDFSTDVG